MAVALAQREQFGRECCKSIDAEGRVIVGVVSLSDSTCLQADVTPANGRGDAYPRVRKTSPVRVPTFESTQLAYAVRGPSDLGRCDRSTTKPRGLNRQHPQGALRPLRERQIRLGAARVITAHA